jgi:hypothetical protein
MGKRVLVGVALIVCLVSTTHLHADESEIVVLLELLVKKNVITAEQAKNIQAAPGDASRTDRLMKLLVAQGVVTAEEAMLVTGAKVEPETQVKVAAAEPAAPPAPEKKKSSWTDRVKFSGDVRLRYEGFSKDDAFYNDRRDRFRIRLRPGLVINITDSMRVGVQLRNGDPDDPVSNNTSFDGGLQAKHFNLAQGYLEIDATDRFRFIGGKFDPKSWWTVSDFQWDDDVTVEGLMQNLTLASGKGSFKGLKLATYQYMLEEGSAASDAYLYGAQIRGDFKLNDRNSLGLGAGFDLWDDPQAVANLTISGKLGGNKMTNLLDDNDQLVSDFEILNLFAEWKNSSSKKWPVKLNLFYYQNLGASGIAEDQDTGYFGRLQVGDYKNPGQVAFRYSRYYAEPDALFYAFTQSDTSRSSDVAAHRFDLRIGAVKRSYFNITWYNTRPTYHEDEPLNRWQVDYIVRF